MDARCLIDMASHLIQRHYSGNALNWQHSALAIVECLYANVGNTLRKHVDFGMGKLSFKSPLIKKSKL